MPNMSLPSPTKSSFSFGHKASESRGSNVVKSPTLSTFSLNMDHSRSEDGMEACSKGMSLVTARRMAQHRIDAAANQPQFHIIVWDENGHFLERFEVGAFMGQVQSQIYYTLKPDIDESDEAVVGVHDLLDGGEETNPRDGCTGSWNLETKEKGRNGSKGKDRWWHTERGRWKDVPLKLFF